MTTIAEDYLLIVAAITESVSLPPIREVHIPSAHGDPEKSGKFGAIVLDDDTVGLTYVDLSEMARELGSRPEVSELVGCSPVEAARLYAGKSDWQRSLGMAGVNAISQHVLSRSHYPMSGSEKTMDLVAVGPGDHVGMVGYFPPLVDQIRTTDASLTVIELDDKWLQQGDGFQVTLDPARLSECNKIVCTGAVLVNQTLDDVMVHTRDAESVLLVGPTVGCLPDPLFQRGVSAVGGRQVADCTRFVELWRTQQPWRQVTRRYTIVRGEYPGYEALLREL